MPPAIVLLVSGLLHALVLYTSPLEFVSDSKIYFRAAQSLSLYENLRGMMFIRTPGLSFLLWPFVSIPGEWGLWALKITLHLLGMGNVLLAYLIAFCLTKNRFAAFLTGMACAFFLDQVYWCNIVLSQIPSQFACLLFVYLFLLFQENRKIIFLYASFGVLLAACLIRPENLLFAAAPPIFFLRFFPLEKRRISRVSLHISASILSCFVFSWLVYGSLVMGGIFKSLRLITYRYMPAFSSHAFTYLDLLPTLISTLILCTTYILYKARHNWLFLPLLALVIVFSLGVSFTNLLLALPLGAPVAIRAWKNRNRYLEKRLNRENALFHLCLVLCLFALPLLVLCARNMNKQGFYGLTSYSGAVVYDGAVRMGINWDVDITDTQSPNIRLIQSALESYKAELAVRGKPDKGPWTYPSDPWLIAKALKREHGLPKTQAFQILLAASRDSLLAHPFKSLSLMREKLKQGLALPFRTGPMEPIPGEPSLERVLSIQDYLQKSRHQSWFQKPGPASESLILLQRAINRVYIDFVSSAWFSVFWVHALACLFIAPFFKPRDIWIFFAFSVFVKAVFPVLVGQDIQANFAHGAFFHLILVMATLFRLFDWELAKRKNSLNRLLPSA